MNSEMEYYTKMMDQYIYKQIEPYLFYYIVISLLLGMTWLITIINVIKSEFKDNSTKTMWIVLMVLVPPLGIILYAFIADSQKKKPELSNQRMEASIVCSHKTANDGDKEKWF